MAAEVVIAIAFVVDSSAALASEWSALIQAYIMPMLRRLGEAHPPGMPKFRLAFITYGAQDAPILCKNFFVDVVLAIPAIRDDTVRLGLGQTTCGGGTGLAALEGFVAALELFDILRQSGQMKNAPFLPIFHIFHVAAAMPDSSERPQCNLSPALDSVTWDSLPSELKKRNIHLSTINLRPKLPRFSELHSTSSVSTVAPWFTVRPQHTVLLSGYPTMPQKGTIGMKRPGEPIAADRTPDPKRTKMSPPNINASPPKPKQASPAPPRVQTPATATGRIPTPTPPAPVRIATPTAQPQPPPPSSIPSGPPAPPAPGPTSLPLPRLRQIQDALQAYEATVRALEAAITDARAKGDTALVDRLMPQWTEKNTAFQKLKTNVNAMLVQQRAAYAHAQQQMAAAQQRQAEGQGHQFQQQGQVGHGQMGQSQAGQGQAGQVGHGPAGPAGQGQGQGQMVQSGPVAPDEGDARMGGGDGNNNGGMMPAQPQPPPPLNVEPPPGHMRQPSGGGGARPTGMLPMSMNPGGMTTSPMITQQMQKMIEQKERARQNNQASKQNSTAVWQGLMTWSGPTPSGEPRSISTFVIASSATPERCHAETWPTSLTVTFAEKPAVSIRDLQIWMKRVTPVLCTFQANPRANNPVNNEMAYKSLVAVLMGKNQYFVVPWTLPNGKHSNNVLLFPVQNAGLVGAFFPLNGIPDLPVELPGNPGSSSIVPNPTAPAPPQNQPAPPQMGGAISPQLLTQINQLMMQNGVQLPPPMLMHLAKVGAVQRNEMMRKLILHGQEQRRQRLADAAAAGGGNANLAQGQGQGQQGQGQAGAGMGMLQMGMMGQMGQQQQQQQQHQQQQHQQQQADMAGFNPTQFGLGGGGAGMGGAMGGMSGMGMYSEMMGSAGLPRAVSGGSGGAAAAQ
ncbi:hypothetical protein FB451DRAFT_1561577 [Mycena latifolia]|nr:hypothetical protein FB451DRAFT_1561577 [Mycena latifolia]